MTNPFTALYRHLFPPPKRPFGEVERVPGPVITEYSNAVGRYGPDSPQVARVREVYKDVPGFAEFADGLDRLNRRLGGSGIDWEPREVAS